MRFLGACSVCGQLIHTYRSLAAHLRPKTDPEHRALREEWHAWRSAYQVTLRCRKCGDTWVVEKKKLKDTKRCPRCEHMRQKLGKRRYERWKPEKAPKVEKLNRRKRWARWDGLKVRNATWVEGDATYQQVVSGIAQGRRINDLIREIGIPYAALRAIGEHAHGKEAFDSLMLARKVRVVQQNVQKAAKTGSKLEDVLASQLLSAGVRVSGRNRWHSLMIEGRRICREVDIQVSLPDDRRIQVFCDGEMFHGPTCYFYSDPAVRIAGDVATSQAFVTKGHSVLRYSESEIKTGQALAHLRGVVQRFAEDPAVLQVYRTWHPPEEKWTRIP